MTGDEHLLIEIRRMSRLLALVATKDVDSREAVLMLTRAGYTQSEAGAILGMTKNAVALTLFRNRRTGGRKARSAGGDGE
jgi:DNA-directed RNA polymerase specialized sigma24 family protein